MAHDAHEQAGVDRNNAQRAGLIQSNKKVALSIQDTEVLLSALTRLQAKKTLRLTIFIACRSQRTQKQYLKATRS